MRVLSHLFPYYTQLLPNPGVFVFKEAMTLPHHHLRLQGTADGVRIFVSKGTWVGTQGPCLSERTVWGLSCESGS